MPRFFVGTDQISDKNIVITGTDVNHIRNVLRMAPGEEVTVSDGQGMDYFCKIAELTKEELTAGILLWNCLQRFICFRDCQRRIRWN